MLTSDVLETALEAAKTEHLGHEHGRPQARIRATERRPMTMLTKISPMEIEARKGSVLCVRAGDRAQAEALVGRERLGLALNRSRAGRPRELPTIRRHRHNSPQPLDTPYRPLPASGHRGSSLYAAGSSEWLFLAMLRPSRSHHPKGRKSARPNNRSKLLRTHL